MKKINIIFYLESEELHPTFQLDGVTFTYKMYDKRKPGLLLLRF